ncbi:MAG: hypothetical protein IT161_10615 [Bryobacterales bacterium]|nr:hypothetical protein [Bryobacterales bacterium]
MCKFIAAAGLCLLTMGGAIAQAPSGATEEKSLKAYVEAMKKDLRAEKHSILDEAMGLEPAGKAKFWGIYDKYEQEQKAIWNQRAANIKKYAQNFSSMTDATADEIATSAMNNDQAQAALRKKYYGVFKSAMGAKTAARFLQAETTLNNIASLQLLAQLPLIQ